MDMDNKQTNKPDLIALTGGNGFIGKHLMAELSKSSIQEVRVLSRNPNIKIPEAGNFRVVIGDLADRHSIQALVDPGCTVINLAYSYSSSMADNILCANNLAEVCAKSKVKRIIHLSTASVFGKNTSDFIDEDSKCSPRSEYGINKYEIEQIFRKNSICGYQLYTLRPTSVFGVGGLTLKKMINEIQFDGPIKRYFRESLYGSRQLNLLSVSVLIKAIIFFSETESADFGNYIISQDYEKDNNYESVSELVYSILSKKKFVARIPLPWQLLEVLLWLKGRHVNDPRRRFSWIKLKNSEFRHDENFNAVLKKYISDYLLLDRRRTDLLQ